MTERVKVRFPFTDSEGRSEVESMWTLPRNDGLEVDNIPFYAKGVALGDVVSVRTDVDGFLWYSGLLRPSGHSTIQIWFADARDVPAVREELKRMGCASELSDLDRLVAVDVPPTVPYEKVKAYLDRGESARKFEYQEACLGFG